MIRLLSDELRHLHQITTTIVGHPRKRAATGHLDVLEVEVERLPGSLKALVITSDLQGYDAQALHMEPGQRRLMGHAVAEELDLLCELGSLPDALHTGVMLLGDLWAEPMLDKMGGLGDVEGVWGSFVARFRWVAGVAGNHDLFAGQAAFGAVFDRWANTYAIDGQVVEIDGLRVGGVSGVIGKNNKAWRVPEEEFLGRLDRVLRKRPDVVLLHHGPDSDTGRGSPEIREVIERHSPTLICCGHCYWSDPIARLGQGSTVINADSRVVVLRSA